MQFKFIPQAPPAPSDPPKSGGPLNCGVMCRMRIDQICFILALSAVPIVAMTMDDQAVSTLEEWQTLSASEKAELARKWNPYTEGVTHLNQAILEDFEKEYANVPGLQIMGFGNYHSEHVISVTHDFIFDKRLVPNSFLGISIHTTGVDLPNDFWIYKKYVWAPENYERYVETHLDEIRRKLGKPLMTKHEALHALIGWPWEEWIEICREKNLTKKYGDRPWWDFWS